MNGGCHLNRPAGQLIADSGLQLKGSDTYYLQGPNRSASHLRARQPNQAPRPHNDLLVLQRTATLIERTADQIGRDAYILRSRGARSDEARVSMIDGSRDGAASPPGVRSR
jgi:hypothetical protein